MVLTAMVPLDGAVNLYQMVLNLHGAGLPEIGAMHGRAGSPFSTVAAELSRPGSLNEFVVMGMALAKLSLAGRGAMTVNVGKVTGGIASGFVNVVPPPGGGVCTPTEFVLPKLAMKLAGIVAERY